VPDVSGPFDNASFLQAQWFRDRGYLDPSGVFGTAAATPAAGDLGLTAAGFDLTLGLGRAHVRGAYYERTGTGWTETVPANTSAIGPRRDLIVLRRDLVAKTVTPLRIQGAPAASPADPAVLQNEDGAWDLPLFRVQAPASSGTPLIITDLRRFIGAPGQALTTTIWKDTPTVGGSFTIGTGGSRYMVRNGFAAIRTHIGFTSTIVVPDNQGIFTMPQEAWPSIEIRGPFAIGYGGTSHGVAFETWLTPAGSLRYNGRSLTGDGIQLYVPVYPVAG